MASYTQVLTDGTNTYLYGRDRIGELGEAVWTYHLNDALGSLRQITSAEAEVLFAQTYEPYGKVYESSGTGASHYGFSGELSDPSELVYLRARYYQPETGRFISRDTWGGNVYNPQSLNRWSYAAANPVMFVDPSGRRDVPGDGGYVSPEPDSGGDESFSDIRNPDPEPVIPYPDEDFEDFEIDPNSGLNDKKFLIKLQMEFFENMKNQFAVIYNEFSGEFIQPGTWNSQDNIKYNNHNLCLIVAAASRISRILGKSISANRLYEWYLAYDPNYINAIGGENQMLMATDLYAFIAFNYFLSNNISINIGNSGDLFGNKASSSPNNNHSIIISNVQAALKNGYEIITGVIYHAYNRGVVYEDRDPPEIIGHWVSVISMDEKYTWISNPLDNKLERIDTETFINSWVHFASGNNTVVLSGKKPNK